MKMLAAKLIRPRFVRKAKHASYKFLNALLVALLSITVIGASSDIAAAVSSMSLSVDYTPGSTAVATSVNRGSKVDLTAGQPVAAAGTTSQEIIQQLPPELTLTSVDDVTAPAGWFVYYSVDGVTWSLEPPITTEGWAAIRYVKASGQLISQGTDSSGRQLASTDSNAIQPSTGSFPTAVGGTGDGWNVFFDPSTRIFNINHGLATGVLDCHLRTTGARCTGYPFTFSGTGWAMATSTVSTGTYIASSNRIFFPTTYQDTTTNTNRTGFGCVSVNPATGAPSFCTTKFIALGSAPTGSCRNGIYNCAEGLAQSGTRLFAWDVFAADYMCLDTALNAGAGAACANGGTVDFGTGISLVASSTAEGTVGEFDGKIYGTGGTSMTAVCVDALTLATCPGWTTTRAVPSKHSRFFKLPATVKGAPFRGACFNNGEYGVLGKVTCWNAAGTDITASLTPEFTTVLNASRDETKSSYNPSIGTRLYWGVGSLTAAGYIRCWDFALNSTCTNWPVTGIVDTNYQIDIDPTNEYCIWSNADDGIIQTYDALTGQQGACAVAPATVIFQADSAVPRMSCQNSASIQGWKSFTLTSTTTYTSATLTVKDSAGAAISGWTNVTIPGSKIVDLSLLTISQTGQAPTFSVTFVGRSATNSVVTARITAIGGSPELCLTPTVPIICSSPFFLASDLAAKSVTSTASGNSIAGSNVTSLNSISASIAIAQTSPSACGGNLTGMALSASGAAIANSTVTLYDSIGAVIGTTSTDANGAYAFNQLVYGTYKTGFVDGLNGLSVTGTAVASGGSGVTTDTTPATSLMSAAATISPGVDAVINATYNKANTLTKAFVPATVAVGEVTTLVFTVNNNATARSGIGFVDTFPAGMVVDSTPNITKACYTASATATATSTVTAVAGDNKITVSAMSMTSATTRCTIAVSVKATTAGALLNTHSNISGVVGGVVEDVNATLNVVNATSSGAFLCDANLYEQVGGVLYRHDPIAKMQFAISKSYTAGVNALGYNSLDGFIYGIATTADATNGIVAGNLVRYRSDGVLENLGAITGSLTTPASVVGGDMDNAGNLIVKLTGSVTTLYSINVTTRVSSSITLSAAIQGDDLGFTGGKLYSSYASYVYTTTVNATSSWTSASSTIFPTNYAGSTSTYAFADGSVIFIDANRTLFQLPNPATATTSAAFTNLGSVTTAPADGGTCHARPTMSKAFGSSTSFVNTTVPLTFTVTNSLGAPEVSGAGFVDNLPNGMTFVPGATVTGTCNVASAVATDGTLTVMGLNFASGETDCTVIVQVVAAATGTYTNGPANMTTTGIDPPADAVITMSNSLPVPVADTTIGPKGLAQTIDPLANDTPTGSSTFTPTTVKLCSPPTVPNSCSSTSLTVANEGTYTVNATTGVITFTPLSTFTGAATPITYQVTDSLNAVISTTYTPTVVPLPTLVADTSTGTYLQTQTIPSPLTNDSASSLTTLVPSTLKYCATTETPNNCTKTTGTITTADGTYTINPDGTLTFMPLASFKGTVTQPLKYQVSDAVGNIANSTVTPYVTPPAGPVATAETKLVLPSAVVSFTTLTGTGALAHPTAVGDPAISSVCLLVQPANTTCVATVAGVQTVTTADGTYRLTVATGVVAYTASASVTAGSKIPVTYRATDAVGNTVTSTLTPITPATPTLTPDTGTTPWDTTTSVAVLTNDTADTANGATLNLSSLKLCVSTATTCTTTTLTVANQGTYSVNADGTVSFDPLPTFSGTATPIRYFVTDSLGQIKYSTLTMTVSAPNNPVASPSTQYVIPSGTATFPTLTGASGLAQPQAVGDPAIASVCLVGTVSTSTTCDADGIILVAGEGTYTLNSTTGVVTFVALAGITAGTKTPMYYMATDAAGHTVKSTLTPIVPAAPTLVADTNSVGWDVTSTVTVLSNDTAASPGTLDPTKVKLCITGNTAPACTGTTLTVANQGTYTVNANGTITFDPLPTFFGTATPVTYSDTDSFGQTRSTTLTVTVATPANPVASPSTKTVLAGSNVAFPLLTGATGLGQPSAVGNPAISTACLLIQPANTTCQTTVVSGASQTQTITTAAGTYVLNVLTGEVVYTANANAAVGNQTPVTYKVTDAAGHTATSTLTPVVPSPPTATADTSSGNWDIIQTISVLTNDTAAGSATLNPSTVKLCGPSDVAPNCTLTTLVVANQGTYTVNSDGTVSFDPLTTFSGTATPVRYSVTDSLGLKSSATITPTVAVPAGPTVIPNTKSVLANTTGPTNSVAFSPILGAGGLATPGASPIVAVCLIDPTTSNCAATANGVETVTTAQGTYVLTVATGVTVFTPANGVTGTLNPITYKVTDAAGQSSTSTLTPIIPPLPTAAADYSSGEMDKTQTLSPLGNDSPGASSAPLVASTLCLVDSVTHTCVATNSSTHTQTLTTANGTYVLDVNTGTVLFTPTAGFLGFAAPATYQITDSLGQTVTGTLNPKTLPTPAANATSDVPAGVNWTPTVTVPINVLANDSAGTVPTGYTITGGGVVLDPTSVRLCGPGQSLATCSLTSLTVPGEGTYTVNTTTGVITFDPVVTFTGTVSVSPTYKVCNLVTGTWTDSQGGAVATPPNTCASATVTPTINPVAALVATNDTTTAEAGITQSINLATNDTGVSGTSSVKICGVNETSPNCTQTQVTVAGVGTYVVSGTTITFIPLATYRGTAPAMPYVITDELGRSAAATYAPTVTATAPPVATSETKRVLPGVTSTFTTIAGANGLAVAGSRPLTPSLTCLIDGANGCVQSLTTASGTWSVDPATSQVSFTAIQGLAPGALPSVTYEVFDTVGNSATATLTPLIPELPVAANDVSTGSVNVAQTISILGNDTSRSATPIAVSTIKLCDIGQTGSACIGTTVTVVGQGTYTVNSAGIVTFTPANNYIGTLTPINYVATDSMGQLATAQIAVSVTAPAPVATNNSSTGMQDVAQTFNITNNDTAASGFAIDPTSTKLCETQNSCTSTSLTTAQGTFTLDSAGQVSFMPVAGFIGTVAPQAYSVKDTLGQTTAAVINITVTAAPAPTANDNSSTGLANTVQTINVLSNDTATAGYPIVNSSVKLCASNVADSLCNSLQVVVPEGTYSVNASGVVTFTPNSNFVGTPTAIKYVVSDTYGSKDSALIQPVVTAPAEPTAVDNTSVNMMNVVQTFNVTNNDTAATNFAIDPSTARLCTTALVCASTTLTVANQGTYVIAANGDVVFTPVAGYVGTATPVKYVVQDTVGQSTNAFIRVTVNPTPVPIAVADVSSGLVNVPQVINLLANDSNTPGYPIVASTIALCASGETAPNCTATTVVIAGQGTYAVDATGVVTFTPALNYFGSPTPVAYVVTDTYGSKATALITPVVTPPAAPIALGNGSAALVDTVQNFNITDNDTAAPGFQIDRTTAALCAQGQTSPNCVATTVTVAGQGTYVLSSTGDVVFTPVSGYIGTATPIRYQVKDNLGQVATALIEVFVNPIPVPVAVNDNSSGYTNAVQTIAILANDVATTGYPIVLTSVVLCDPSETAPVCTQTSVTFAGEGVYSVNSQGVVTFTPDLDYIGTPTPVTYVVTNTYGSKSQAIVQPVVQAVPVFVAAVPVPPVTPIPPVVPEVPKPLPTAKPDVKSGKLNQVITLSPVLNDVNAAVPLVATSIVLCITNCDAIPSPSGDATDPNSPVVPGEPAAPIITTQGTWTVAPDTGAVSFTPAKNWFGRASIKYVVFDAAGNKVFSTITITIPKPKLPKVLVYTGDVTVKKPAATHTAPAKFIGTITAPRLGAKWSQKIFEGTSVAEVLNPLGLGHYSMTSLPGKSGNFAIAGHRFGAGGPFLNIDKFKTGDLVYVNTKAGKFTYRFLQSKVVAPSATDVLLPHPAGLTAKTTSNSILTLQTCTPVHVNNNRLIVWFELVK